MCGTIEVMGVTIVNKISMDNDHRHRRS